MAWSIPDATPYSMRRGDRGIHVWALQRAINSLPGSDVVLDGIFGSQTEEAVRRVQSTAGVAVDGIAGPVTQRLVGSQLVGNLPLRAPLPRRLLEGFGQYEGGWLLAAVNWSVAGGVDCGVFQRRVYEIDYRNDDAIERAFNTGYQARLLADRLAELRGIFIARAGTNDGYEGMPAIEKAWRLAALNHNYPSAADRLSRTPIRSLPSYWTTAQQWVTTHGFRFPDGTPVRTPLEWTHMYAGVLQGRYRSRGTVTGLVTDWTP